MSSGPDDFDLEEMTPIGEAPAFNLPELEKLLGDVRDELRKLSHPAFEAKLLEEIRKQLLKQHTITGDLQRLLRELNHDLQWVKKHLGALHLHLTRLGVIHEAPPQDK